MRFCVTGGCGFVGSHTVDLLIDRGHRVTVIDDLSTGRLENLNLRAEFVRGSILHTAVLREAVAGADYVIHLAARPSVARSIEDPEATNRVNVDGTLMVLQVAHAEHVKRVVVASSSSVYGDTPTLPKVETMRCRPRSPYAVSKMATEMYALAWRASFGLEAVALRYFNVYGPRQRSDSGYAAVIPAFVKAALLGKPAMIYGDGEQTRDFTFVRDVAEANIAACLSRSANGQAFNICGGQEVSLLQLHGLIAGLTGKKIEPIHCSAREGDVRRSIGNYTEARTDLSWVPTVSLKDGIRATIEAMRKQLTKSE